jgi:hypothetical protein
MALIAKFRTALAVEVAAERVSGGTATTMFNTMSNAMPVAAKNQEDIWGPNTVKVFHGPHEKGIAELNRLFGGLDPAAGQIFAGDAHNVPDDVKNVIRLDYEAAFNAAIAAEQDVTGDWAIRTAHRVLEMRTGGKRPGAGARKK